MKAARRLMFVDMADPFALVASGACMFHCLILPLTIALLPTMSEVLRLPESFHVWMVVIAIPTSVYALIAGARGHRDYHPLLIGSSGLSLLTVGALLVGGTKLEPPATVAGALILAGAHILNWRRGHARSLNR